MKSIRKISGIREIYNKYSTFFLDLDGVIWIADKPISKNVEAVKLLQQEGKRIVFISNSSVRDRNNIMGLMDKFGIKCSPQNVYTSSISTAMYIKQRHPQVKKVMVVGSQALTREMNQQIKAERCVVEGAFSPQQFTEMAGTVDKQVDAVVVGIDYSMNFKKLALASLYIQMGKIWFATNRDKYIEVNGYKLPGAGTCVAQIAVATDTQPILVGKPNPYILHHIMSKHSLKNQECVMVGDNLHTDIQFANNGGIDSVCTMTGVTSWEEVQKGLNLPTATYYCDCL